MVFASFLQQSHNQKYIPVIKRYQTFWKDVSEGFRFKKRDYSESKTQESTRKQRRRAIPSDYHAEGTTWYIHSWGERCCQPTKRETISWKVLPCLPHYHHHISSTASGILSICGQSSEQDRCGYLLDRGSQTFELSRCPPPVSRRPPVVSAGARSWWILDPVCSLSARRLVSYPIRCIFWKHGKDKSRRENGIE